MDVLLTFTGFHDPYFKGLVDQEEHPGPILSLLSTRSFEHIFLFDTPNTQRITEETKGAINRLHRGSEVHILDINLSGKGLARWREEQGVAVAGGLRLMPVPQSVPWPRCQSLPITTARAVFPQAAHPLGFTTRGMGPLVLVATFTYTAMPSAGAGPSSPKPPRGHRRDTRDSIAATRCDACAAVSAASAGGGFSSQHRRARR
jgi:hypothetical protein